MAFGISGSSSSSRMLGADVAVAYYDAALQRGVAADYNITDIAPVSTTTVPNIPHTTLHTYSRVQM